MKVLKFGGTSVGSVDSILSVKRIVTSQTEPVVVVVSALGGITDRLIETSRLAMEGDMRYQEVFQFIVRRHEDVICGVMPSGPVRDALSIEVHGLLEELRSIYYGVYLIRDISSKTLATIVSYGERMSSRIVATVVDGARWYDSREVIRTEKKNGKNVLCAKVTNDLVRNTWKTIPQVSLMAGFISSDIDTGEVTNLGRGGSDYTAAIVAAALDATVLEIWTDVDGFMTADPKVIGTAYVIDELSYVEAMELCNFGAKVIYPPTIYPVCLKNIPIRVKNTFNPDAPGTIIKKDIRGGDKPIRGISSIKGTAIINVSGLSMVGVIGVNRRIFTCLADNGISVFMVSQASSENSTSIGVRDEDASEACHVLNEEFSREIAEGAMYPMSAEGGLATVAIVGENMKHTPGVAGKLFGTLGRSGISVIACAQGASETNVSFVISEEYLRKALNVIHDSFFLSEYQVLNLFVCGVGTVGGSLIEQICHQREKLKRELHLQLNVVGIASGHNAMFSRDGLDLENFRQRLAEAPASNMERLHDEVIGMNIFNSVFVDCTASSEVASLYKDFLSHNINIVAANKIAASSDYEQYSELKRISQTRGVKFLFETNVGAGLPIIRTINDLCNSGDKILRIEAVLSGTLNYIFNTISADIPFSKTVEMAKVEGYSEPDPRIDLSGRDVLRKLVILAREAGYRINQEDVETELLIPQSFFDGTLDEFWRNLPALDSEWERRREVLESEGKVWRFVATYESGRANISLREIEEGHPFYQLEGSNNIVLLTTERYNEYPMLIQGYGAGASVTAAGVFADIMSLA
ncbi:MAG: bifunctional aspartate kinase/homoserine dehydrogenase I [Bacteroides sp.]|nr:bifunctional aspartate kinase/homoserine dehydrogenase I [Bacteroides sp.]MCM1448205.1 bifunctional aspartate kinase/homoserine dehydrogenase I [Bacteroides sp.]MCM1515983.1 bifunctional aspartate kinase/homoserine dehydrogenase I [Paraprevotella sp.]